MHQCAMWTHKHNYMQVKLLYEEVAKIEKRLGNSTWHCNGKWNLKFFSYKPKNENTHTPEIQRMREFIGYQKWSLILEIVYQNIYCNNVNATSDWMFLFWSKPLTPKWTKARISNGKLFKLFVWVNRIYFHCCFVC